LWAPYGAKLVERRGIGGVRVERDGIWVGDGEGLLCRYTPFAFGSAVWAELSVQWWRGCA
jgi:hypothetical protein